MHLPPHEQWLSRMPPTRYWPGINARPDAAAIAALHDTGGSIADAWHFGLALLHQGYYWESHEVLEPVWLHYPPNSRERHLVQALIHLANAALKHCRGSGGARDRILQRTRASLRLAWPATDPHAPVLGLHQPDLLALLDADAWAAAPPQPPPRSWAGVLPGLGQVVARNS